MFYVQIFFYYYSVIKKISFFFLLFSNIKPRSLVDALRTYILFLQQKNTLLHCFPKYCNFNVSLNEKRICEGPKVSDMTPDASECR